MNEHPGRIVNPESEIARQWNRIVDAIADLRQSVEGGVMLSGGQSLRGASGTAMAIPEYAELEPFRVPSLGVLTIGPSFDLGSTPLELERVVRARTGEYTITPTPAMVQVWAPPWWKGSAIPGDLVLCERRGGRWRGLAGGRQVVKVTLLPPGFTAGATATTWASGQTDAALLKIWRGDLLPTTDALVGVAWASWNEALMRWEVTGAPC